MNVLVLNAGSATLKFELIRAADGGSGPVASRRLVRGVLEGIGGEAAVSLVAGDGPPRRFAVPLPDLHAALDVIVDRGCAGVAGAREAGGIDAVGHRVVHGGERFREAALITDEVLAGIEAVSDLAPLHNPANLAGIRAARARLGPGVPQVAVFDTAFHQTLPPHAYLYALPRHLYERHRIRRYGFHGTSHRYVSLRYAEIVPGGRADLVTLHLGNGCSAAAIRAGASVDTSMGFTPLEGLVMGTRSGDVDPALVEFIGAREGLSSREVGALLNEASGLAGLSGLSRDMRELLAASGRGHEGARLAIEVFCHRARKYVGAYLAALGGAEALVFTGGIGEHAPAVRARICDGLEWMGLRLDPARNDAVRGGEGRISAEGSRLAAWVIPTDEEWLIARDTVQCVRDRAGAARGEAR